MASDVSLANISVMYDSWTMFVQLYNSREPTSTLREVLAEITTRKAGHAPLDNLFKELNDGIKTSNQGWTGLISKITNCFETTYPFVIAKPLSSMAAPSSSSSAGVSSDSRAGTQSLADLLEAIKHQELVSTSAPLASSSSSTLSDSSAGAVPYAGWEQALEAVDEISDEDDNLEPEDILAIVEDTSLSQTEKLAVLSNLGLGHPDEVLAIVYDHYLYHGQKDQVKKMMPLFSSTKAIAQLLLKYEKEIQELAPSSFSISPKKKESQKA